MKEKLLKLFPEIEEIKEKDLREKVIMVFIEAVKRGGWKIEDLNRIPFTLLIENCPVSFLDHCRGVTKVVINTHKTFNEIYGEKMKLNRDYLIAGAILHDVGKLLEYEEKDGKFVKCKFGKFVRHPISGAALCYEFKLPEEIIHMVALHSKEGDPFKRSPEGAIIHHADFMNFEPLH